jgi:hypothetical protein
MPRFRSVPVLTPDDHRLIERELKWVLKRLIKPARKAKVAKVLMKLQHKPSLRRALPKTADGSISRPSPGTSPVTDRAIG